MIHDLAIGTPAFAICVDITALHFLKMPVFQAVKCCGGRWLFSRAYRAHPQAAMRITLTIVEAMLVRQVQQGKRLLLAPAASLYLV
jgi:hypothetical protein